MKVSINYEENLKCGHLPSKCKQNHIIGLTKVQNMKPIFLCMLISCVVVSAFAQKIASSKVPQEVINSFTAAHPAVKAKWEKEKDAYEVNFNESGKRMSCVLNAKGVILETETEIDSKDLPVIARDYVNKAYKRGAIKEAAKIVTNTGETTYEAQVNKKDLIFDASGSFLKAIVH
jgi:hypothetical protein